MKFNGLFGRARNDVANTMRQSWDDLSKATTWDTLGEPDLGANEVTAIPEKLEQLEIGGFIDTENPETIQKYKDNLNYLADEIKNSGRQDKFMLIREDDNFPYGYKWELSSASTQVEAIKNPLTTAIRREIARSNHPESQSQSIGIGFMVPGLNDDSAQISEEASKLDPSVGVIYGPAHFRSTKHFTINTALGHTGSYNQVESNRNFTIIDTIDNFENSPYRYSLAYEDAYVDATHEQLEISEGATVLMSKERYEELKDNQELMDEIAKRKLVLYSGDESTAINMYLTELGIFPNNVGWNYHDYDQELVGILDDSIKKLAVETDTPYGLGHGNINDAGGHFSSFFDDQNQDYYDWERGFLTILSNKFPDSKYALRVMSDYSAAEYFVAEAGLENVMTAIKEINDNYFNKVDAERQRYDKERASLSNEDKQLMRNTVRRICDYFKNTDNYSASRSEIYGPIQTFYQAKEVQAQIEAARQINRYFDQK